MVKLNTLDRKIIALRAVYFVLFSIYVHAASLAAPDDAAAAPACSAQWYRQVEQTVMTGDGQGHGPDPGSDEWKSVIEFKLGLKNVPDVPSRSSDKWCRYIDQRMHASFFQSKLSNSKPKAPADAGPTFSCTSKSLGGVEKVICQDPQLAALDHKLAGVFSSAQKKAANEHPPFLQAEQRGWIKGRNDCWKQQNKSKCILDEYINRIAELQARYRLVNAEGPVRFICEENQANEVIITYFPTEPASLIAERGDQTSFMLLQKDKDGRWYQGRNERIRATGDEALISWGYNAPEMKCRKAP